MNKRLAAGLSLALLAHPVAALACENPRDVAALKTAALHQRLMVAALICKSNTAYNRFVLANRAELQRSDADLKAYFIAQGGEEGYDSYKTRVANLAARAPAIDMRAFCASAAQQFQSLSTGGLQQALTTEPLPANVCKAAPVLAAAKAGPATKLVAAEEVTGIAAARIPAMPYSAAPPPVARMVREVEPINPTDIVPPESYAGSARAAEPADDYAPSRLAYAPESGDGRYDAYAPPAPRYAPNARRGERYWYYRSLYARPRSSWRD